MEPTAHSTRPIRDYVGVKAHPTVVQLAHLDAPDAAWITEAYYRTPQVEAHLDALRTLLRRPQGCGLFLVGQYGSGKSHFLAYVTQNLRAGTLIEDPPDVVAVSLLHYRGATPLEVVVGRALGIEATDGDRRIAWRTLQERHPRGLVLVLDELSEFLRSKPDARRFTEDVRFLQFLGEWAQVGRFFVLAGMQEQIEHTGDIDYGLYRKIKDRYPIRLLLTPAHVRELVSEGILVKRAGYAQVTQRILDEVRRALPDAPLDEDALRALYPLHPLTLDLLEEVRDRFSQTRGIVDFTVTQLEGRAERSVPPFLDRPVGDLLTPDAIIDHFRDLLELQAEFQPIAQKLFPYYERHMASLFEPAPARILARRVLKLLVLCHLSPARTHVTAQELAYWLLIRVSRIDAGRNVGVLERILAKLATEGRYVVCENERYRLELGEDDRDEFERRLQRELRDLDVAGAALFTELVPLLEGHAFDVYAIPRNELQHRNFRWHFHPRRYALFLGDEECPKAQVPVLCIRFPWSEREEARRVRTILPRTLPVEQHHRELAAHVRLRQRTWSEPTRRKLETRLKELADLFANDVRDSYLAARVIDPAHDVEETVAAADPRIAFDAWLDKQVEAMFRRAYPSFERFAPGHGPLPQETLRRFTRFCAEQGDFACVTDETLKLVFEAYLVPMGLLKREGFGYAVARNLERSELVRMVLPLLEHAPSPRKVHEHLAQPVYGLLPDQTRWLLLFLWSQGEIELHKEGKTLRELAEMFPDPLQYDEIVPAEALPAETQRKLELLCEAFEVRLAARASALTQRRAIRKLFEAVRGFREQLQPMLFELSRQGGGDRLRLQVEKVTLPLRTLEQRARESDDVDAFTAFVAEIEPVDEFVERVQAMRAWPDRFQRMLSEVERLRHLLGKPGIAQCTDADAKQRLEAVAQVPPFETLGVLESWLQDARAAYDAYCQDYRERHERVWGERIAHAAFTVRVPDVARSAHLDLADTLETLMRARERVRSLRCTGKPDLAFQVTCTCGYGTANDPVAMELARFDQAWKKTQDELTRFFGRSEVRQRMRAWVEAGLPSNEGTEAYLAGEAPWPDIANVEALDRHLAGTNLVRDVSPANLAAHLGEGTLTKQEAKARFAAFVDALGDGPLRFREAATPAQDALQLWCVQTALQHGIALPPAFASRPARAVSTGLEPHHVGEAALQRLETIGLDHASIRQILEWLVEGRIALPAGPIASPLVRATREVFEQTHPCTPRALAELATLLYRAHAFLSPVAGERWLARLDALATATLDPAPPLLTDLLEREMAGGQWWIVDCLGLPLLEAALPALQRAFTAWTHHVVGFARVDPQTTTDAFYRAMIQREVIRQFEKENAVDERIHARFEAFEILEQRVASDLEIAATRIARRFDPALPIVVFADHGFRIARDGRSYRHGGSSTLERLVPVVRFTP